MNPVSPHTYSADLIIVGAGAAGLTAAGFAGEAANTPHGAKLRIALLDGAKKPGAKILVSGGGRCNVTHCRVTPEDYSGGPRPLLRAVLKAFDEKRTLEWMAQLGVELHCEESGKYFPVSNQARTVLDALVSKARASGVEMHFGRRVLDLQRDEAGFILTVAGPEGTTTLRARAVIFAPGGLALPKSGSDGAGIELLRRLGHTIIPTTPALVPLVLRAGPEPGGCFAQWSGITLEVKLTLVGGRGEKIAESRGSMVFTHFGISGPAALNLSRHYLRHRLAHPEDKPLVLMGHPQFRGPEEADAWLREQARLHPRHAAASVLAQLYPERIARVLAEKAGALGQLTREQRLGLARNLTQLPLRVESDRGYAFAEATAGGVDLREVDPRTMQSRIIEGLYLCGEVLDVDGRIGGFNFQWAWATGYLAGKSAVAALSPTG